MSGVGAAIDIEEAGALRSARLGLWAAASFCCALAASEPAWRAGSVPTAAGLAAPALWAGLHLTFGAGRGPWARAAGAPLALLGALAGAWFALRGFEHWISLAPTVRDAALSEGARRLFWGCSASLFWLPSCLWLSRLALLGLAGSSAALAALLFGAPAPF